MDLANENRVPFFQVDAFSKEPFRGNPTARAVVEGFLSYRSP
jgi:predicted PhzF superfamily epimerase YddE/YHI9